MNKIDGLRRRILAHVFIFAAFASYTIIFTSYYNQLGPGIASLST
jgi:hypothetical protein